MVWVVVAAALLIVCGGVAVVTSKVIAVHQADAERNRYYEVTMERLKEFDPDAEGAVSAVRDEHGYYFKGGGESFFRFKDGSWLFVVSRSFHADEDPAYGIGDIQLAVDDRGNIYRGAHHWCGGVVVSEAGLEDKGAKYLAEVLKLRRF